MAENLIEMKTECPKSELAVENNTENKPNVSYESSQRLLSEDTKENTKTCRLPKLTNAIDRTVERCISAASLSIFANNLPLKKDSDIRALKTCYLKFKEHMSSSLKVEVETMFLEESIPQFMSALDQLSQTSSRQRVAWRPTGVPADDAAAHLIQPYTKYLEKLKAMLKEEEVKHEALRRDVVEQRHTVTNRLNLVKGRNDQLKQITSHCSQIIEKQLDTDFVDFEVPAKRAAFD